VIRSLIENIGQFVTALFISFFEGRMFSRWIVTNITIVRGAGHCLKTRIPCGDQHVICGLYHTSICLEGMRKTKKKLSQGGRDLNPGPLECEAGTRVRPWVSNRLRVSWRCSSRKKE
jgi:hypothetical protein